MTVTSAETTNTVPSVSSEKLAGWPHAYRLKLLRYEHDIEMLKNDTLGLSGREESAQGDLIARALWSANLQRREAVRTVIDRAEAQTIRGLKAPSTRVAGMEKWEGRVLEVEEDYFTVELVPFGEGAEVIADFSTDLLSKGDDIRVGDVVYVTVRTVADVGGPTRTSAVRLRRLGIWTESEVAEQSKRAKKRLAGLASRFD